MTEKLKPCPFCGSSNIDWFPAFGDETTNSNIVNIACIDCGSSGPASIGTDMATYYWNKRHFQSDNINSELLSIISEFANSSNCQPCRNLKAHARKFLAQLHGSRNVSD